MYCRWRQSNPRCKCSPSARCLRPASWNLPYTIDKPRQAWLLPPWRTFRQGNWCREHFRWRFCICRQHTASTLPHWVRSIWRCKCSRFAHCFLRENQSLHGMFGTPKLQRHPKGSNTFSAGNLCTQGYRACFCRFRLHIRCIFRSLVRSIWHYKCNLFSRRLPLGRLSLWGIPDKHSLLRGAVWNTALLSSCHMLRRLYPFCIYLERIQYTLRHCHPSTRHRIGSQYFTTIPEFPP